MKTLFAVALFASSLAAQPVQVSQSSLGTAGRASDSPFAATNGQTFVVGWQEGSRLVIGRADPSSGSVQALPLDVSIGSLCGIVPVSDGFLVFFSANGNFVLHLDTNGQSATVPRSILGGSSVIAASAGDRVFAVNDAAQAVILSADGDVLVSGLTFTGDVYPGAAPAVAASHDQFLFAQWTRDRQIRVTTLRTDGTNLSTTVVPIAASYTSGGVGGLSAASDGAQFVVMWANVDSAAAFTMDTRTVMPLMSGGKSGAATLAWSGSEYVAVATTSPGVRPSSIRRIRFGRDLIPTGNDGIVQDSAFDFESTQVAAGGGQTLVMWLRSAGCPAQYGYIALSFNGGTQHVVTLGTARNADPAIAAGSGSPLVVWREDREQPRFRAAMLDPVPRALNVTGDPVVNQSIASNGSGFLAAYYAMTSDCHNVVGVQAIDAGGNLIVDETLGASATLTGTDAYAPAVAWNGNEYLVAWMVDQAIMAVRVSATGGLIDPAPRTLLATKSGFIAPRIVWAANQWNVIWYRSHPATIPFFPGEQTGDIISLRRFDRNLQPIGDEVMLATNAWSPAVATDGSNVVLSWRDQAGLHAGLLTAAGTLSGVANINDPRSFVTPISAAALNGAFYILDLGRLYAYSGGQLVFLTQLPGTVGASALAANGNQLIATWSANDAIYSSALSTRPGTGRRRSVH